MAHKNGRMHFIRRDSAENALLVRGETEETTRALLTLAETYGSVEVLRWRGGEDSQGDCWSLTVSSNRTEYALDFKNHKYY